MDKTLVIIVLPFIIWILIVAWLFYATFGNKRVKLSLRGLGITIDVQTSNANDPAPFRSRASDKPKE
jgi:hypothetical protein